MNVLDRLLGVQDVFGRNAPMAEELGHLPEESARAIRDAGVIRMLQPKAFQGDEAHPAEFFRVVLEIGRRCGSSGWVAGVVGVHPHGLARGDERMQAEIWAKDPDTWVASPYAPLGRARRVDGGYILNGRWPFSSGTDYCQWVVIGGLMIDDHGVAIEPSRPHHFVLPRSDYVILEDSWKVMGLKGTGSKDLLVTEQFVPLHRVIDVDESYEGETGREIAQRSPLYGIPRAVMFSGAVTAGTLAMCQGVVDSFVDHASNRTTRFGKSTRDPFQMTALAEAAAEIETSIRHFLWDVERVFDSAATGEPVPMALRAEVRRNQVRASHRAMDAADKLFRLSGGASIRLDNTMQRMWRDAQSGLHHVQNVAGPIYEAYGLDVFGQQIPTTTKI
jgi:3-hydroxy-9,10-secoandrosta-1,3,5(10)-triene-9,17-dione monooxygenase